MRGVYLLFLSILPEGMFIFLDILSTFNVEGVQKKMHKVLLHTKKMIDPRAKSQARGQNNRSRALK